MLVLGIGIWLIFTILIIILIIRWNVDKFGSHVEANHRAAEDIINHACVPTAWLQPFHDQLTETSQQETPENLKESVGQQILDHCVEKLDTLIRYFEKNRFAADEEARSILLESLTSRKSEWMNGGGQSMLALAANQKGAIQP